MPNPDPEKSPTPRQIRRQQQREANLARQESQPPVPVMPIQPAPEILGPSMLVPVYCALIVMAYLLFHVSGFAVKVGNEMSQAQSVFTAVNAATLTGFQQARTTDNYLLAGQVLTFILMLVGILFSFIGGGVAVIRIARMRFTDGDVIRWSFGSILVVALLGGIAMLGPGRRGGDSIYQAISAFGNCGLTLGVMPAADHAQSLMVLLPLAAAGGLGLPVLMELFDWFINRRSLSRHSRVAVTWSAGVMLFTMLALFLIQWPGLSSLRSSVTDAAQLSVNARSAGFPFASIATLPQAAAFVLIFVMLIGASPAGTGGGLKVTTLHVLSHGTISTLQGRPVGRRFGVALIWLLSYLGMLVIATVALLISEPDMHLDRTFFLAASALGNVGLSHNPVTASRPGLYILSATMLFGRIAPVMMLWYTLDTVPDAEIAI